MGMLISIDNGGTLTDACVIDGARVFHAKTLTTPRSDSVLRRSAARSVKRIYGESKLDTLLEQVDYIRIHDAGHQCRRTAQGSRLGLIVRTGTTVHELTRNDAERELLQAMVAIGLRIWTDKSDDEIDRIDCFGQRTHVRGSNRLVVSWVDTLTEDENR